LVEFDTEDVLVYLASAGSGKTKALMDEVRSFLLSYRPDEVALVTFTRKGVSNAIDRILAEHKTLREDDLPYVKTLHAMSFKEADLKHKNIIERRDMDRFNKLLGFNVHLSESFDNTTEDDKLLQRYDAVRAGSNKGIFIERAYDEERYSRLVRAYEAFKEENELVDFYDCLIRFRDRNKPISAKVALIDEAQDLTPLQWEVCRIAFSKCEKIRIAGDDYQSLFSYAGASPQTLIALSKRYTLVKLEKSYRLPRAVHDFAHGITRLIRDKVDKDFTPVKDEVGFVRSMSDRSVLARLIKDDLEKNGFVSGRWYLLFRNNCFIADITGVLERYTIPYHTSKGFCISARDIAKVKRYLNYRKMGYGSEESRIKFCADFGIKDLGQDFTESNLIPDENRFVIKDYVDEYGIDKLEEMSRAAPFLLVTTPHRVKGGEADFSCVFLDCTRLVSENVTINLDEELRVLYVACTRAKIGLYLVPSVGKYGLDGIVEIVKETVA
jgi:DNA helicase-2/ATP-dependent DNA helicase PcrA